MNDHYHAFVCVVCASGDGCHACTIKSLSCLLFVFCTCFCTCRLTAGHCRRTTDRQKDRQTAADDSLVCPPRSFPSPAAVGCVVKPRCRSEEWVTSQMYDTREGGVRWAMDGWMDGGVGGGTHLTDDSLPVCRSVAIFGPSSSSLTCLCDLIDTCNLMTNNVART